MANNITTTGVRYDLVPAGPRTSGHVAERSSTRCPKNHALITALINSGRAQQAATRATDPGGATPEPD